MSDVPMQIIVAAFQDENEADQALKTLKEAKKEKLISIDNAAVIRKDEEGKLHIKETADMGGGKGAGIGTLVGGAIGNRLDEKDKEMATQAAHQAFENNHTGAPSSWQNPDTGASGSITPTRTYQIENGQYCREYTQDITVGGEKHQTYGTACRQSDGSWKVQN